MQQRSETLKNFWPAFFAVQQSVESAAKDGVNPHFKSKYATLESVWEVLKDCLGRHDLAMLQSPTYVDTVAVPAPGEQAMLMAKSALRTTICHVPSGEWVSDIMLLEAPPTAQGQGSGITYARRYAACTFFNIQTGEDDDGNSAMPAAQTGNNAADWVKLKNFAALQGWSDADVKAFILKRRNDGAHDNDIVKEGMDKFKIAAPKSEVAS